MTRKMFFAILASPFVVRAAVPPEPEAVQAANSFGESFNRWGQFRRQTGIVDAQEIQAWATTRLLWKKLDRTIKYD